MTTEPLPSRELLLERFYARDESWNGRFLVGVTTTGIYCIPSCAARKPLPENVLFFSEEAAAVAKGLRPCRRCRPDRYLRDNDPVLERLETALASVTTDPEQSDDAAALAAAAGVSRSTLHSLVRRHYHSAPASLLRRRKIDKARRELLRTSRSILDIAHDCGFSSLSAFNANFRRMTGLTPGEYRALAHQTSFNVALPANYRAAETLRVNGRDALSLTERVNGNVVVKRFHVDDVPVELEITLASGRARCTFASKSPLPAESAAAVHQAALRMLGIGSDSDGFERRAASEPEIARLVSPRKGLRIPGAATPFEALAWSIVGQQVNLPFAFTLRRVMVELCGVNATDKAWHPTAAQVAALDYEDLTRRQFSRRKAEYLIDTARLVATGELPIDEMENRTATEAYRRLMAVRGIGEWSANYVMMRGLGFADCLPLGDTGLRSGLKHFFALEQAPDEKKTAELMEMFAPHRSLATFHIWMSKGDPA
jgi:AraC family transcriptional regulator of adaptative response / DNA-3-methyladenine glycosylase II